MPVAQGVMADYKDTKEREDAVIAQRNAVMKAKSTIRRAESEIGRAETRISILNRNIPRTQGEHSQILRQRLSGCRESSRATLREAEGTRRYVLSVRSLSVC